MLLRDVYSYVRYRMKNSFAQHGEDKKIAELFPEGYKGFYLDIGCSHPFRISNTYLFYKMGWSGVAADPIPHFGLFWRIWRPRDHFLNCGIGPASGNLEYYELLPSVLSTFVENVAQDHIKFARAVLLKKYSISVISINQLLSEYATGSIDLVSIDVEGLDFEILKAWDFERFRPKVISAEFNGKKDRELLMELFKKKGYDLAFETSCNLILRDTFHADFII